ncbi:mitochondrial import receptor subunit TOM70-like [Corticium candelabrum]|uniref:mitochondrial import receptor subunit TOM70-like n=1 Tax=Corticium candelabrum TaxID=121492 RepID=UPI002E261177|nr:mitochondrial import receptor subunit TOM70-like [Corticium candelabrum]
MSDEGSTIPKFQIVLAAGIPVAALCIGAIAYYRWRKRHVSPVFQESSASASAAATGTEKENIQNSSSRSEVTDTSTETPTAPQEHIKSSDEEAESRAYRSPVVRARESKEKGNKHFKEGRYEKAIEYYTQAINFSPPSERSALAVYHHNRAAAYDQLSAKANGDEKKKFQENILADCSEGIYVGDVQNVLILS